MSNDPVRICPERDKVCPHGMRCPWTDLRYSCKPGWQTRVSRTAWGVVFKDGSIRDGQYAWGDTREDALAYATARWGDTFDPDSLQQWDGVL